MSSSVAARPSSRIWVPFVNSSIFSQCPEDPVDTSIVLLAGLTFLTVPSMEKVASGAGETCIRDREGRASALQEPAITASTAATVTMTRKFFRIPLPPFPLGAPLDIPRTPLGRRHPREGQAACHEVREEESLHVSRRSASAVSSRS